MYHLFEQNAKKGSLIVDCSTIDPIVSKELAEEAKAHGLDMIDAPVSGGVGGALNGTLTFMVGGSDVGLQKAMVCFVCDMNEKYMH